MITLTSQSSDIKRSLHDPTRGQVVLVSASGVDIYRTSDWTRVAWAVLANITCAAINDYGIYLGTSDTGVWRLPLGALDAATTRLEQVFRPGDSVELSSSSILDIAGTGTALAIISGAEFLFLPTPVTSYAYTDTGTPTKCAISETQLAYGTDGGGFVMSHPAADWDDSAATQLVSGGGGGYALRMDGTGDYVSVPDATSLRFGTQDFKISARVKLRDGYDPETWPAVASKGGLADHDWGLWVSAGYWRFYGESGGFDVGDTEASPVETEVWTDIEAGRNGDNAYLRINGTTVDSATGVGSVDFSNTKTLCIGALDEGASRFFDGDIDSLVIEVDGVEVASWQLDEGSGSIANDSVGSNDGTIQGDPQWINGDGSTAAGLVPQALAFGADLFIGTQGGVFCNDGSDTTDLTDALSAGADVRAVCPTTGATANSGLLAYGTADDADGGNFGVIDLSTAGSKTTTAGDVTGDVWIDDALTCAIHDNRLERYRLVAEFSPAAAAREVRRDWTLYAEITDALGGIQAGSVVLTVNGVSVTPSTSAIPDGYAVAYTPGSNSGYAERVTIELSGLDTDGNTISKIWSFVTASAPAATVTDSTPPNVVCTRDIGLEGYEADETVGGVNVVWLEDIAGPLIVTDAQAVAVGTVAIDEVTYHKHIRKMNVPPIDANGLQTRTLRKGQVATMTCPAIGMTAQKCEVLAAQRKLDDDNELTFDLQIAYYEQVQA